jgi:hypothetical protein
VPVFESASVLDDLDDDQRQAAIWPAGPLLVLAEAGTGNTRTLVARPAWLRGQGLEPSRILLLTFTRRAAEEMLSRSVPPAGAASAEHAAAFAASAGDSDDHRQPGCPCMDGHRLHRAGETASAQSDIRPAARAPSQARAVTAFLIDLPYTCDGPGAYLADRTQGWQKKLCAASQSR